MSEATKTLGVWLAPNGDEYAQVAHLRSMATQISSLTISSILTRSETYLAYRSCLVPAITYSFAATTMSVVELTSLQAPALQCLL